MGGANPGHSGYLAVDEDATSAIAASTNGEQGVNAVSMELDSAAPKPPDQGPPPTDLQQYEGEYGSHVMQATLRVVDGTLTVELNGATAPLVPQDAQTFSSMLGPIALLRGPRSVAHALRAKDQLTAETLTPTSDANRPQTLLERRWATAA